MSNSSGVTSKSTVTNEVTDTFQYIHDKGYGSFKGMVTKALNLVEPMARKVEESYAENYRWANTGGAVLAGIGGALWLCYGSWSFMFWSVAPVVPAMYVGHRITQSNNSARAISPQVIAEPAVTDDTLPRAGNHTEGSSLLALSRPPDSSNLPVRARDTLSEVGSEETAAKVMEGVGALLKNIINLVEMADDLAERYSVLLATSLYQNKQRVCNPEIKECQLVEARKELKTRYFLILLRSQVAYGELSETVYRDILKSDRDSRFVKICNFDNVDYEKVAEIFLAVAERACKKKAKLEDPAILAHLLNQLTSNWNASSLQGGDKQKAIEDLLYKECKEVRPLIQKIGGGSHLPTDSAYGSLSAPVANGASIRNLRQRHT